MEHLKTHHVLNQDIHLDYIRDAQDRKALALCHILGFIFLILLILLVRTLSFYSSSKHQRVSGFFYSWRVAVPQVSQTDNEHKLVQFPEPNFRFRIRKCCICQLVEFHTELIFFF